MVTKVASIEPSWGEA